MTVRVVGRPVTAFGDPSAVLVRASVTLGPATLFGN